MRLDRMSRELFIVTFLGVLPALASAQASVMTVEVMAKIESDALAQVYQRATKLAQPSRPAPKLLAIHGVQPVLQAQLWIDGTLVLFEQGQTKPLVAHVKGLRLRTIKPPCVSFDIRGQPYRLCLPGVIQ